MNNLAPSYLTELINIRQPKPYELRLNCDTLYLNIPRKPHYKKSEAAFKHNAPATWNSLPYEIRNCDDVERFKTSLKTFLFKKAFSESTS